MIIFFCNFFFTKEGARLVFPLLISQILKYFEGTADFSEAILYAFYISIGVTVNCIIHHPYFLELIRIGIKMRLATSGLLYKKVIVLNFFISKNEIQNFKFKAFKLNLFGPDNQLAGQLLNMLSNDGTKIELIVYFLPYLLVAPIESGIIVFILIKLIDVSILSGLVIIAISIPIQSLLGKALDKLRYLFRFRFFSNFNEIIFF